MKYEIIGSSSKGNCLIFNDYLMIDCGVTYAKLKDWIKNVKIILLTHIHSDHYLKSTIKKIAYNHPNIKFVCGEWLVDNLVKDGVSKKNIYVVDNTKTYTFGSFILTPIETYHDVRNMSYKINFMPITMYYATDTSKLDYLDCLRNLDYYFVEANYSREELEQRIEEKMLNGDYVYEKRVLNSHMSMEDTNEFLMEMMGDNSKCIYCHQHLEKGENNEL